MARLKSLSPYPDYGDRIKRAIGYRKRTQREVALKIGLSTNAMSLITRGETKEPSTGVLRALADELDVSVDYLMGLSEVIEPRKIHA